jgi:hypothetical protein
MKQYPRKLPYKWIKKYDLMTGETSNILIFKQEEGHALDSTQKVVQYSKIFYVLRDIHEVQAGNNHPQSRTLYRRVCARYGKSTPRWICESFPLYCPVCVRSKPCKKPKAGNQPLLTRRMNICMQIDLIDYQSIPDGPYNYVLDYQDHSFKVLSAVIKKNVTSLNVISVFVLLFVE